jgi:putative glutamine amidotransferase
MMIVIATDGNQPNAIYVRALICAGALPEEIVVVEPGQVAPEEFDGLLLAGGPDVAPARYGEVPSTPTLEVFPERDALDMALVARAERSGAPVFGICRGLQVLNVARGGTLWQDLPSQRDRGIAHAFHSANGFSPSHPAHGISVPSAPAGVLGELLGSMRELIVNSRHHQAVKEIAPGLRACAVSSDDSVEALERPERFFGGVQWHPEDLVDRPDQKALFRSFLDAGRAFARQMGRVGRPPIEVRLIGDIPVVWLSRHAHANCFGGPMTSMLADTIRALATDSTVPAIVLAGEGDSFSDGYDPACLAALLDARDRDGLREALESQSRLALTVLSAPRPVLAALDGPASGCGLALALACDVRVASGRATFLSPGRALRGCDSLAVSGGLAFLLAELAGPGVSSDVLFSGDPVPLSKASALRLVDIVVEEGTALDHALCRASVYAEQPAAFLAASKGNLNAERIDRLRTALKREADAQLELFQEIA